MDKCKNLQTRDVYLNYILIGECQSNDTAYYNLQKELIYVAEKNGAKIQGMLTRLVGCKIIDGKEKAMIEVGFILDIPILHPQGFRFLEVLKLINFVSIEYRGAYNLHDIEVGISKSIEENNFKLTGKVYNHVKYVSKDHTKIKANVYLEIDAK